MKRENFIKKKWKTITLSLVSTAFLAVSCEDPIKPIAPVAETGIYILNEGGFNMNNSTLSFYNFKTGNVISDIFLQENNRGLGDVGNDLKAYGSKQIGRASCRERV